MAERPVYSTAGGRRKDDPKKSAGSSGPLASGPAKMRLETKGRGGKAVTVLWNLPLTEADAKGLMKELQGVLGCGATFKDGQIEIQGDHRDRVDAHFLKRGLKLVRAGG